MRYLEFITEQTVWDLDQIRNDEIVDIQKSFNLPNKVVDVALNIAKDCQPYLHENKWPILETPLFRDIYANSYAVKKQVRLDDRKPVDVPEQLHKIVNQYFNSQFGAPFRNAMFCTGSHIEASGYGNVHIIFPIGNFEYLWSPEIDDLWEVYKMQINNTVSPEAFANDIAYNGEWKQDELQRGIESKHEIMIRCNKYYGLRTGSRNKSKRMELLLKL